MLSLPQHAIVSSVFHEQLVESNVVTWVKIFCGMATGESLSALVLPRSPAVLRPQPDNVWPDLTAQLWSSAESTSSQVIDVSTRVGVRCEPLPTG